MATAFCSWSVSDVKHWINSWDSIPSIEASTIKNMKSAADLHHIDGQKLIFFTRDDLKQCGLPKRDIQSAITRIDDLVLGAYLDYIFEHQYHFSEFISPPLPNPSSSSNSKSHHRQSSMERSESMSNLHRDSTKSSKSKHHKHHKHRRRRSSSSSHNSSSRKSPRSPSKSAPIWKEGWILKKSEHDVINHYDKRFMRLQGHYLLFYKRDITQYPRERPTKCFNLLESQYRVESNDRDVIKFYLIDDTRSVQRKFKARSKNDRDEWVLHIRRAIKPPPSRSCLPKTPSPGPRFRFDGNGNNDDRDKDQRMNAMQSVMDNKEVQNATYSAMQDEEIRNPAIRTMANGGNDVQQNKKLFGALARNKAVQGAAISVAKDEKVQRAAYGAMKRNATMDNAKKAGKFMGSASSFM